MWWTFFSAQAATLTVGGGQMYPTISAAVNAASDGDTIEIHPGTYIEDVRVNKSLDLVGVGGSGQVTVRSAGGPEVFDVLENATFTGLTVDGQGATGFDAGQLVETLAFTDIHVFGAGSMFVGPGGSTAGGAIEAGQSDVTVTDSLFTDNTANHGGAISASMGLVVRSSTFLRNTADSGGAINAESWARRPVVIVDSHFEDNVAEGSFWIDSRGGAVMLYNGRSQKDRIKGNVFCNNAANRGGAVWMTAAGNPINGTHKVTVRDNLFVGNTGLGPTSSEGGALFLDGNYVLGGPLNSPLVVPVLQNTFLANDASDGAAIYVSSEGAIMTLKNDLFAFSIDGAAVWQDSTEGDRDHSLFFDNAGGDLDGGLTVGDFGPNTLFGVDPMLTSFTDDGNCGNDDTSLRPGSPAIDAGDPQLTDPDGTVSDIGWTP